MHYFLMQLFLKFHKAGHAHEHVIYTSFRNYLHKKRNLKRSLSKYFFYQKNVYI